MREKKIMPSRKECMELLEESVNENVVRHSLQVNKIAMFLGKKMNENGENIDLELLDRASLLHDLDKIESLEKGNHGIIGEKKLKERGWHEIAGIVRKHVLDQILVGLNSLEEKIVFYADKRVKHTEIVSLKERLQYIHERYGKANKQLQEKGKEIEEKLIELEKEILRKAKVSEKLEGLNV